MRIVAPQPRPNVPDVGKSSLYRALRLLADVAQGRIIQSLAGEGGLHSTLWAGPESFARSVERGEQPVQGTVRKASLSLKLGFAGDDYGYAIDLGLPQPSSSAFARDPEIKVEALWTGETLGRSNVFAARNGPSVRIRSDSGEWPWRWCPSLKLRPMRGRLCSRSN
jgi:predicted ATPase